MAEPRNRPAAAADRPEASPSDSAGSSKLRKSEWRAVRDRVTVVFDALAADGIVALHEAGQTQEDGFADCAEASDGRAGVIGFCFYTRQDAKRAKRARRLALAFWGAPGGDPEDMERVGTMVVAAFRRHGFVVQWDGTGATRPVVDLTVTRWRAGLPRH